MEYTEKVWASLRKCLAKDRSKAYFDRGNSSWRAYWRSRYLRVKLLVLCLAMGGTATAFYACLGSFNKSLDHFRCLEYAIARNDVESEIKALRNLLEHSPDNSNFRYGLALAEARNQNQDEAHRLMLQLSEESHPDAALWIAQHEYAQSDVNTWEEQRCNKYKALLETAAQGEVFERFVLSKKLLSTFLFNRGEVRESLVHLADLAVREPEMNLHIAKIYSDSKEQSLAFMYASRAREYFEDRLKKEPTELLARMNLTRSLILLQQEHRALALLADGYDLTRQPILQQASSEVLVAWSRRLEDDCNSLLSRVQLIHRATQCSPSDRTVIASLLSLVSECLKLGNASDEKFLQAIVSGGDRESLHFIFGLTALERGKIDDARLHLDLAALAGSELPTVLNNIALAVCASGDLIRALTYADAATERLHDQPHFCETRGRILFRLGRFEESIIELKKGLRADELKSIVYPSLAFAYRKVGNVAAAIEAETQMQLHESH